MLAAHNGKLKQVGPAVTLESLLEASAANSAKGQSLLLEEL